MLALCASLPLRPRTQPHLPSTPHLLRPLSPQGNLLPTAPSPPHLPPQQHPMRHRYLGLEYEDKQKRRAEAGSRPPSAISDAESQVRDRRATALSSPRCRLAALQPPSDHHPRRSSYCRRWTRRARTTSRRRRRWWRERRRRGRSQGLESGRGMRTRPPEYAELAIYLRSRRVLLMTAGTFAIGTRRTRPPQRPCAGRAVRQAAPRRVAGWRRGRRAGAGGGGAGRELRLGRARGALVAPEARQSRGGG